jgi:hypothetical protein
MVAKFNASADGVARGARLMGDVGDQAGALGPGFEAEHAPYALWYGTGSYAEEVQPAYDRDYKGVVRTVTTFADAIKALALGTLEEADAFIAGQSQVIDTVREHGRRTQTGS